jgi:hypothetical protein
MERLGRETPLPPAMQVRWVAEIDPEYEMNVEGGDVFLGGGLHEYAHREELIEGDEIHVRFESHDRIDPSYTYTSLNLTLFPDHAIGAYSDDFGMVFVRPEN